MTVTLKIRHLFQFVALWSVVGYPFLASLTAAFGGNNSLLSIILRGLAGAAALAILLHGFRSSNRWFLLIFLTFWLAYFARLVVSLYVLAEPSAKSPEIYWIWAVGACFLPSLAVLIGFDALSAKWLLRPLIIIATAATVIGFYFGTFDTISSDGTEYEGTRYNSANLNPIAMGHLGVTVILLAVSILSDRIPGLFKFIAFTAIGIGSVFMLIANSRGPVVALAVSLMVLFFAHSHRRSALGLALALFAAAGCLTIFQPDLFKGEYDLVSRFTSISSGRDLSAVSRFISFRGAFDQFVGSPIFGDGLEERITQYYPHNVILEAFMATGLVGGVPFVLIIAAALRASWQLLRRSNHYTWIGLLTVQYIVGAQFSGAIYNTSVMWVLIGLAIAASRTVRRSS